MDALDTLFTRKSIRQYTDQPITEEQIHTILRAGMSAPSAHNQHPRHFIVIQDREILNAIGDHFLYGKMLDHSPLGILLCCDTNKLRNAAFWPQDMSAAAENMLLAARAQALGGVRVGVYPEEPNVNFLTELFKLPAGIIPFSIISVGYPAEHPEIKDRFSEDRVHRNQW